MLVLFDLDGTLTDPYEGITRSVAYAVDRMSLPPLSESEIRAFIGPPLQNQFALLGLDAAGVAQAVSHYRERFTDRGLYENRVYGQVPEALQSLAADFTLAVATSKPVTFAERIVDHFALREYLSLVAGATMDGTRREKSEIIGFALEALEVPASEAVMVGDRSQDVDGAHAHGMPYIGVQWGYAEPGELERAGADVLVRSPSELMSVLSSLQASRD